MADSFAIHQLDSLEHELGTSFNDRALMELALVHSSYINENPEVFAESNERLEFLGDALLGLVITQELYQRLPERPEGELTALRAALVRGETLAQIADSLHLGQSLLMGTGEQASGGRERQSNLAAAFEALVGALFLDQGYLGTRVFVLRVMADRLSVADHPEAPKNAKSLLQEVVQAQGEPAPSYRIVKTTGKDHLRQFMAEVLVSGSVMGAGEGMRKSLAEQEAARDALKAMGHDV